MDPIEDGEALSFTLGQERGFFGFGQILCERLPVERFVGEGGPHGAAAVHFAVGGFEEALDAADGLFCVEENGRHVAWSWDEGAGRSQLKIGGDEDGGVGAGGGDEERGESRTGR